jgi:hypothetical protein
MRSAEVIATLNNQEQCGVGAHFLGMIQSFASLQVMGGTYFLWLRTVLLLTQYLPYVSETGTVFESLQIGETCTNLRPPPSTTLGRAPRLCWWVPVPPNLSNLFDGSATIIISI